MKPQSIAVICTKETEKGVQLKSRKTGDELWFPKAKVKIINGEFAQGIELTVQIDKNTIQWAQQNKANRQQQSALFTTPVLVAGMCTENRPKAIGVLCDEDHVQRWLAKAKIIKLETEANPNQPVRIVVPAWMLKRADNRLPEWVKGAIHG